MDVGAVENIGQPPELEDREFELRNARAEGTMSPVEFWAMLYRTSRANLRVIFGAALTRLGLTYVVDLGLGSASLGVLRPTGPLWLGFQTRNDRPRARLRLGDTQGDLWLTVTDARLFLDDLVTPDRAAVQYAASRLSAGVGALLSVGLTRPFSPGPGEPRRHWLQVNYVHLREDPLWDGALPNRPRPRTQPARPPIELPEKPFG